jgi:hypothetical protein
MRASEMFKNPLIRKLQNFVRFSEAEELELDRLVSERRFVLAPREEFVSQGESAESLHVVLDGWACHYKDLPQWKAADHRPLPAGRLLPRSRLGAAAHEPLDRQPDGRDPRPAEPGRDRRADRSLFPHLAGHGLAIRGPGGRAARVGGESGPARRHRTDGAPALRGSHAPSAGGSRRGGFLRDAPHPGRSRRGHGPFRRAREPCPAGAPQCGPHRPARPRPDHPQPRSPARHSHVRCRLPACPGREGQHLDANA